MEEMDRASIGTLIRRYRSLYMGFFMYIRLQKFRLSCGEFGVVCTRLLKGRCLLPQSRRQGVAECPRQR